MDPWFLEDIHFRMKIPRLFSSVEHGGVFTECVECGRDLRPPGTFYLIEKALRASETIYEFALCLDCREGLETMISEESKGRIEAFFESNAFGLLSREIRIRRAAQDRVVFSDMGRGDGALEYDLRSAGQDARPDTGPDGQGRASMLLAPWIDRCLIRTTPEARCKERVLIGVCDGPDLLVGPMPWMLSDEALENMQEILSVATKEELGRWKDETLGMPPELEELLRGPRFVLV